MKNFFTFLSLFLASCLMANDIELDTVPKRVDNDFNCLFAVQSVSGSNPTFTVTGTLSNASGKFAPLHSNIDTGEILLCEYVQGSTRFTASFEVAGITPVSGNKVTLTLNNVSGRVVAAFPTGTHSIRRPSEKGLLPTANGESAELRTAVSNHNLDVLEDAAASAWAEDIPSGAEAVTLVCVVEGDPDLIPDLAGRTDSECAWAFDSDANQYYFYDGSKDSLFRWSPIDSIPLLFPVDIEPTVLSLIDSFIRYDDNSFVMEINRVSGKVTLYSDDQGSIVEISSSGVTVTANDITLQPRGSGKVKFPGTPSKSGSAEFAEDTDNGTNKITLKAPDSSPADYTLELPAKNGTIATDGDVAAVVDSLGVHRDSINAHRDSLDGFATRISDLENAPSGGGDRYSKRTTEVSIFDDFLPGEQTWTSTVSSATIASFADTTAYGTIRLTAHTLNAYTGYYSLGTTQTTAPTYPITRNANMEIEFRVKHDQALNPISQGYHYFGIVGGSNTVLYPQHGIFFYLTDGSTAVTAQGGTRNGTTQTLTTGSNIPNATPAYHVYKIVYTHSTGTAEFFVDGASIGSLTATMPATTTQMRLEAGIYTPIGQGGGAARTMTMDYASYRRFITR